MSSCPLGVVTRNLKVASPSFAGISLRYVCPKTSYGDFSACLFLAMGFSLWAVGRVPRITPQRQLLGPPLGNTLYLSRRIVEHFDLAQCRAAYYATKLGAPPTGAEKWLS